MVLTASHLALDIREWGGKVKQAELPVDQPPAVASTALADVWPRATGNRDKRRPMRRWRGKDFDFFEYPQATKNYTRISNFKLKVRETDINFIYIAYD